VDGLQDDICVVITLKRPSRLYIAYYLALLQEEVADLVHKTDGYKPGINGNSRNVVPQHRLPAADKPGDERAQHQHQKTSFSHCACISGLAVSMKDVLRNGCMATSVLLLSSSTPCKRYGIFSILMNQLNLQRILRNSCCWLFLMMPGWVHRVTAQCVSMAVSKGSILLFWWILGAQSLFWPNLSLILFLSYLGCLYQPLSKLLMVSLCLAHMLSWAASVHWVNTLFSMICASCSWTIMILFWEWTG
jgi:hypothetical protein